MRNFKTTNEPWNLMRPSIKISYKDAKSKNLKLMYTLGGQTIEKLKKYYNQIIQAKHRGLDLGDLLILH